LGMALSECKHLLLVLSVAQTKILDIPKHDILLILLALFNESVSKEMNFALF